MEMYHDNNYTRPLYCKINNYYCTRPLWPKLILLLWKFPNFSSKVHNHDVKFKQKMTSYCQHISIDVVRDQATDKF